MNHLSWKRGAGHSCSCGLGVDHSAVAEIDLTCDWQVSQLADCYALHEDSSIPRVERMRLALEEFRARGGA